MGVPAENNSLFKNAHRLPTVPLQKVGRPLAKELNRLAEEFQKTTSPSEDAALLARALVCIMHCEGTQNDAAMVARVGALFGNKADPKKAEACAQRMANAVELIKMRYKSLRPYVMEEITPLQFAGLVQFLGR
jgi:hypothetical protein